ncbi:hypothetical protein Tco_0240252, partial [Tanacetum coccineum]
MVLINNNRTLVGCFKQPNAAEVVCGCGGRGDGDGGVAVGGDVVVARGGAWVRGSGRSGHDEPFWSSPENFSGGGV